MTRAMVPTSGPRLRRGGLVAGGGVAATVIRAAAPETRGPRLRGGGVEGVAWRGRGGGGGVAPGQPPPRSGKGDLRVHNRVAQGGDIEGGHLDAALKQQRRAAGRAARLFDGAVMLDLGGAEQLGA